MNAAETWTGADVAVSRPVKIPTRLLTALLLAIGTVAVRLPNFGDPSYHIDEQFYLVVGKAMLDGDLPYVDLWDRKPLGLFLIYAFIAALPGSGVAAYHFLGGLFVWATACVIAAIARPVTGPRAAILAGLLYIALLEPLAGGGGQAPVFYNFPMALAFALVLRARETLPNDRFWRLAATAMLLCGTALFVKPTAFAESLAFGLLVLASAHKRRIAPRKIFLAALAFAAIGIAPMLSGFLFYAALGHADAYWFANFVSIFTKPALPPEVAWGKLHYLLRISAVIVATALAGLVVLASDARRRSADAAHLWALWLAAAIVGFASVPNFYDHYGLPVAAPLALCSAPLFRRRTLGLAVWALPIYSALSVVDYPNFSATQRSRAAIEEARSLVQEHLHGGCMYMFDGPVILYALTNACRVTTRIFPEHMNLARESDAVGIEVVAEMKRIVARRPAVMLKTSAIQVGPPNLATTRILEQALAQHYRRVGTVQYETHRVPRTLEIYALRH